MSILLFCQKASLPIVIIIAVIVIMQIMTITSPPLSVQAKFCANWTENGTVRMILAIALNEKYRIAEYVLKNIRSVLCVPEIGGILGIDNTNTVVKFHYDITGVTHRHNYIPDVDKLNKVINEWAELQIEFIGFVHSHGSGKFNLSSTDIKYAKKIKDFCNIPEILMLLYIPDEDIFYQYIV